MASWCGASVILGSPVKNRVQKPVIVCHSVLVACCLLFALKVWHTHIYRFARFAQLVSYNVFDIILILRLRTATIVYKYMHIYLYSAIEQFKKIYNRWRLLQITRSASCCIEIFQYPCFRRYCSSDFRYATTATIVYKYMHIYLCSALTS